MSRNVTIRVTITAAQARRLREVLRHARALELPHWKLSKRSAEAADTALLSVICGIHHALGESPLAREQRAAIAKATGR